MNTKLPRVIALGFFDGVHLGHGALLTKTNQIAAAKGLSPAAMSFDAPPAKDVPGLISSAYDRREAIGRLYGIRDVIFLHFDDRLRTMAWDDFITWLARDFRAAHLVAGYDFRFGYRGVGNASLLAEKCRELGIGCSIVDRVEVDGEAVSSTRIRALLEKGDMESAAALLGHPYFLSDLVREGHRVGRTIGIPTMNLHYEPGVLVPRRGVYAATAHLPDGEGSFPAVTNVGVRPTLGGTELITCESYLLGYEGNLYGQRVRVDFARFLRDEEKFPDLTALKEKIGGDIEAVKSYFGV